MIELSESRGDWLVYYKGKVIYIITKYIVYSSLISTEANVVDNYDILNLIEKEFMPDIEYDFQDKQDLFNIKWGLYRELCKRYADEYWENDYDAFIQEIIMTRGQWNPPKGEYYERHHIVPRCMGGEPETIQENNQFHENLIWLTRDEHVWAHKLLCDKYPNNPKIRGAYEMMIKINPYVEQFAKTWTMSQRNQRRLSKKFNC